MAWTRWYRVDEEASGSKLVRVGAVDFSLGSGVTLSWRVVDAETRLPLELQRHVSDPNGTPCLGLGQPASHSDVGDLQHAFDIAAEATDFIAVWEYMEGLA